MGKKKALKRYPSISRVIAELTEARKDPRFKEYVKKLIAQTS
ncbi:MAG: hypothetical protein V1777_04725 [Candidatus Micrarchaeota archaeon]